MILCDYRVMGQYSPRPPLLAIWDGSLRCMVLGVLSLAVTLAVAVAGFGATYLTNLRLARRKDRLDRVNRQLSELYGPLYAQAEVVNRAWRKFADTYGIVWSDTAERAATWRLWMSTVFMPLNRRMVDLVVSHGDLLIEDTIPESLKELCAHVACYEPVVARWQEDGFSSVLYEDHVSIAGNFPRTALDRYLKSSFEALKREQAELLAQIQHRPRPLTPSHDEAFRRSTPGSTTELLTAPAHQPEP